MINTQQKRTAAAMGCRRLPWFRRFTLPPPDGSISKADREQLAYVYGGFDIAKRFIFEQLDAFIPGMVEGSNFSPGFEAGDGAVK